MNGGGGNQILLEVDSIKRYFQSGPDLTEEYLVALNDARYSTQAAQGQYYDQLKVKNCYTSYVLGKTLGPLYLLTTDTALEKAR